MLSPTNDFRIAVLLSKSNDAEAALQRGRDEKGRPVSLVGQAWAATYQLSQVSLMMLYYRGLVIEGIHRVFRDIAKKQKKKTKKKK